MPVDKKDRLRLVADATAGSATGARVPASKVEVVATCDLAELTRSWAEDCIAVGLVKRKSTSGQPT